MTFKDKEAGRAYARDYMRRRRADGSAAEPKPLPPSAEHDDTPPTMPKAALPAQAQQHTPAAASKKCIWSVKNICILFVSQNFKPIRCYGYNRLCEGPLDDINTIPFKQCRESDETQQLAL